MPARIINRGRGPEIKGTRITVFDVLDYQRMNWSTTAIADFLHLSDDQVHAALDYIAAHKKTVMNEYRHILAKNAQGNAPEVRSRLTKSRQKLLALQRRLKGTKQRHGVAHERTLAGH
jgi:uncharacterized protein (DUF433 family)